MSSDVAREIRVAIIGAGRMAREHARAFLDISDVKLVGIHSRTKSKAEVISAEMGIQGVYDSIEELYDKSRPDLVIIAVSILAAREVCRRCFAFPCKLLLEKPPGYNLAEAEAIQAMARISNHQVWVALNRRFYSSTQAMMAGLAEEEGPRFIHVQDQQDRDESKRNGQPDLVIQNLMFAVSIHVIDYLSFVGRGEVTRVTRAFPKGKWDSNAVIATVEFSSGDRGIYEGIWDAPGPWFVAVNTPRIRWELRPLEQAAFQRRGERTLQPVAPHAWDVQFKPGLRAMAESVVTSVRGGTGQCPTLRDAITSMRLIQAIFFEN